MKLEDLTKESIKDWSEQDWENWYETNKEEPSYSDFTIREAKESDLKEIRSLVETTHFECEPETATKGIVAVKGKKIIGYQEIETFHNHDTEFLRVMVIHPEYRGQGIGEAIVSYIISEGGRYQCNIHQDNEASLNLFEKLGFTLGDTVNGLVQVYYGF
ncbi:MAG: GNAT family N-acetyltransferase [archaeon]